MLVNALLQLVLDFLGFLFGTLNVVLLPAEFALTLASAISWLMNGVAILAAYTHFGYLLALLSVVFLVNTMYNLYSVIMWILRKIPFLGIGD